MSTEDQKLLLKLAAKIKTGWELCGSKWKNCEAETIALQTISACAMNLRNHNEALSWQGTGTLLRGNDGTNNPKGVASLVDDGSLILEEYTGELTSPDQTVRAESGKPMVFRVTRVLLHYAASMILKDTTAV